MTVTLSIVSTLLEFMINAHTLPSCMYRLFRSQHLDYSCIYHKRWRCLQFLRNHHNHSLNNTHNFLGLDLPQSSSLPSCGFRPIAALHHTGSQLSRETMHTRANSQATETCRLASRHRIYSNAQGCIAIDDNFKHHIAMLEVLDPGVDLTVRVFTGSIVSRERGVPASCSTSPPERSTGARHS